MHGTYFLARVVLLRPYAHSDASEDLSDDRVVLDLVVGKNVVIAAHPRPVAFLADLDERIRGDTTVGKIDSAEFASVLVDGVVTSYLEHADTILGDVDTLDGRALKSTGHRGLLADLVALRHRIAAVRRMLVAHRTVIAGIAGPTSRPSREQRPLRPSLP